MARKQLEGRVFGQLTVQRFVEARPAGKGWRYYWECVCSCGTVKVIREDSLLAGKTVSCECAKSQKMAALGRASKTHGCSHRTTEYGIWANMISRCTNPKVKAFKDYGGRGITVCDRWRNSFENFLADMGPRPSGMTLDRKDNDKGYEPGNCRWVDRFTQASNQRRTLKYTALGRTMTITEWATECGIERKRLYGLLRKKGVDLERLLAGVSA